MKDEYGDNKLHTFTFKYADMPKFEVTVCDFTILGALAKAFDYCTLNGYDLRALVSVQRSDGSYMID